MESYIDIEESIFLSRVEHRGFHVGGRGYHVEGNFVSIFLNVLLLLSLLLLFLKMKIVRGHSNSRKSKKTFPSL